jgi:hypothetical protein
VDEAPVGLVTPTELDFGSAANRLPVQAYATQEGLWSFTIATDRDWLTTIPESGSSTGPNDRESVVIYVERDGLVAGDYEGTVMIGDQVVAVTMTVDASNGGGASAVVNPDSLDFGADDDQLYVTVDLITSGTWEFVSSADESWITVSPTRGTYTSGSDSLVVSVSVDRRGLSAGSYTGTTYIGELEVEVLMQVTSGGGSNNGARTAAGDRPSAAAPA